MINFKRKKSFIAAVTAALCAILMPSADYAGDSVSLTPEYLASGSWGPENIVGMKIRFNSGGSFDSELNMGQSYCTASGKFSIKGGKLELAMESSKSSPFCGVMTLKEGVIVTDKSSPKYRNYILFRADQVKDLYLNEDLKIWDYNSKLKEGESVTINGTDAVVTGIKEAVTTTTVKVRETPGTGGKEIHYNYESEETGTTVTVKALPKNKSLTVLARTREKISVGKTSNYWYYAEFETYISYTKGWIYGDFVEIR